MTKRKQTMVYGWRAHYPTNKMDAQQAGETLEDIRKQHGGITADLVVKAAEPEHSPIHHGFEWDDAEAAIEYRKEQARDLIASVVVRREETKQEPIRAFVIVTIDGADLYTSTYAAMSDETLRRQVLARAFRELDQWRKRYAELEELAQVFVAIEREREAVAV